MLIAFDMMKMVEHKAEREQNETSKWAYDKQHDSSVRLKEIKWKRWKEIWEECGRKRESKTKRGKKCCERKSTKAHKN